MCYGPNMVLRSFYVSKERNKSSNDEILTAVFDPLLGFIDYWRLDTRLEGLSSRQGEKNIHVLDAV